MHQPTHGQAYTAGMEVIEEGGEMLGWSWNECRDFKWAESMEGIVGYGDSDLGW